MAKAEKAEKNGKKSAFTAKRGNLFLFSPEDLLIIEDKSHPLYDPRVEKPLTESFIRSIMKKGIIQPVVVRKNGEAAEVVAGRRRVRAAREANKRLKEQGDVLHNVPAVVRRDDDRQAFETAIIENEHREDDSPHEKALKAKILLDRNQSEEDVAEIFGVTLQTIKVWIGFLDLNPKVRDAVEDRKIGLVDAVRKLGTIPKADQAKALADIMAAGGASGAEGAARVREAVIKRGGKAGAKPLPGKKVLKRMVELDRDGDSSYLTRREQIMLEWITGEASESRVAEAIPGFVPLLRASEKKPEKPVKAPKPPKEKKVKAPRGKKLKKAA